MKHDRRPGGEVRVGNRDNNKFGGGYVVLEALRDRQKTGKQLEAQS